MRKIIIIIVGIICTACTTDYIAYTEVEYKNNSAQDIQFLSILNLLNPDTQNIVVTEKTIATLPSGSSFTFSTSGMSHRKGFISINSVTSDNGIALIQFGDIVKISFADKYADENIYELTSTKNRRRKYSYTFTDADYQFALEHGTPIE